MDEDERASEDQMKFESILESFKLGGDDDGNLNLRSRAAAERVPK